MKGANMQNKSMGSIKKKNLDLIQVSYSAINGHKNTNTRKKEKKNFSASKKRNLYSNKISDFTINGKII